MSQAQSGDADAPHRALAILMRMEKAYKAGNHDAKPTQPSYNAGMCMHCLDGVLIKTACAAIQSVFISIFIIW